MEAAKKAATKKAHIYRQIPKYVYTYIYIHTYICLCVCVCASDVQAMEAAKKAAAALGLGPAGGASGVQAEPDHFQEEIEINDYPQHARWKATHRDRCLFYTLKLSLARALSLSLSCSPEGCSPRR